MPQAPSIVTYHGARFSPVFRDAVAEWHRLAAAEGIPFTITQGGHNKGGVAASAGTHDGDAIDLSVRGLSQQQTARLIELGRMVGIAAWFRTKHAQWGTPAHGFNVAHIHGVPNGWGHPSAGAAIQAVNYRIGRDGLAGNRADTGPGHVSDFREQTWSTYLDMKRKAAAMNLTDKVAGTARLRAAGEKDKSDLTVAQCLSRGAWAYQQTMSGGGVRTLIDRGAHAYTAIFQDGWFGKRVHALTQRVGALEKKVN